MSNQAEILELEAELRLAELGPNANFFERVLADDVVLDGQLAKAKVVAAHRASGSAKFTKVEMSDLRIFDHGAAVVVTCTGLYEGEMGRHTLYFTRVWLKKAEGWRIIAGSVSDKKPG